MSKTSRKIAEEIAEISEILNGKGYIIYTGIVESVNTEDYTCKVSLNVNDADNVTEGVFVNAALEVTSGLILVPAADSVVWVASLDGGGNMGVIKCSVLDKLMVAIGDKTLTMDANAILLNGDALGGLTKTLELKAQINKLNTLVQHLVSVITGASIPEPGNSAPSALQTALATAIAADTVGDFSNIENTNVKHG